MNDKLDQVSQIAVRVNDFSEKLGNLLQVAPALQTDVKARYVTFLNNQITLLQNLSTQIAALP
jgi:hypothetical protein